MSQFCLGFLNPEGHPNHMTGSKVTSILVNKWILPVGGVVSGRVCAQPVKQACFQDCTNTQRHNRLGKNKLHKLRRVQLFKRFSAQFVLFSAKFGSLNVQIRNKWCKICNYYVNSIAISCCKREKKTFGLNVWLKLFFLAILKFNFFSRYLRFFMPNLYSQSLRVHKKMFF